MTFISWSLSLHFNAIFSFLSFNPDISSHLCSFVTLYQYMSDSFRLFAETSWCLPILWSVSCNPVWPILRRVMTCFRILYTCLPVSFQSQYSFHVLWVFLLIIVLIPALLNGSCMSTDNCFNDCFTNISAFTLPSTPMWAGSHRKETFNPLWCNLRSTWKVPSTISCLHEDLIDLINLDLNCCQMQWQSLWPGHFPPPTAMQTEHPVFHLYKLTSGRRLVF